MRPAVAPAQAPARRIKWGPWLRLALAVAVLGILAEQFGSGPFSEALARLNLWTIAAAIGLTAFTTACNTYRWCTVSGALGIRMHFGHGFAAYFRALLINSTLPGGIVGDVDRGLRERRRSVAVGPSGRAPTAGPGTHSGAEALRAVAWERILGQLLQVLLTAIAVIAVPSALRDSIPAAARAVLIAATLAALAVVALLVSGSGRALPRRRVIRTIAADWRRLRLAPHALAAITVASLASTAGYLAIFMLAAASIGVSISLGALLPMALVILVLGAIPANLAGFGPREGAAAWVFSLAGAGAAQGISVSVLFGVLTLIGVLPGLAVLIDRRREVRRD